MALQGTLDTFALPDVLRLLASTKKTGRLHLTGNRGDGSVWVDTGDVVKVDASNTRLVSTTVDVMFELLRFVDGAFTFEAGTAAPDATAPSSLEPLLQEAERLIDEWKTIESVIPSSEAWLSLAPELPGSDVVVDSTRWRSIVAVGGGNTVWSIGEALGLAEVPLCRSLKELVELGLLIVSDQDGPAPATRPAERFTASIGHEVPSLPAEPEHVLMVDDNGRKNGSDAPALPSLADSLLVDSHDGNGARPLLPPSAFADAEPDEADEVARQLAALSPQAARAVAAAAQASTDEEREAALAEVNDEEEPINRGLLLKFLSSVRS